MESSVKERIREVLVTKSSNPTQLAKEHVVNQKTLNNQINSDVQLATSTILLILKSFPDLSAEWLLRGEGGMLKSSSVVDNSSFSDVEKENIALRAENKLLRELQGLGERKDSKTA